MNSLRIQSSWIWGLTLAACGLLHPVAWAAVEGYYLPGKESIEFRYMYDPSLSVEPVQAVSMDPSRWDAWTAPDGQTRYLWPQLSFGNSDIEGIQIRPRPGEYRAAGDLADYDIQVRLTAAAWERRFRAGYDRQYAKARPVMLVGGRLIDPAWMDIGDSVRFSLPRADMSVFLNAVTPAPQPTQPGDRAEEYRQWLDEWVTAHPEDFLALSVWTYDTLFSKHGCDAPIELLDRYLKGLAAHPDLEADVKFDPLFLVMEIQRRLRAHGRQAEEPALIALLKSSPGLSEKVRDEVIEKATKEWGSLENAFRKDPGALLFEQFQHMVFEHQDCDRAQALLDQTLQIKDPKIQEGLGWFYAQIGGCLVEKNRMSDAEAALARLKASDAKDKTKGVGELEQMIARAKAVPAAPSSEAKP